MLSESDGTILKVPYPLPPHLLYLAQSGRFNLPDATFAPALDEEGEDQVDVDKWSLKDLGWLQGSGDGTYSRRPSHLS